MKSERKKKFTILKTCNAILCAQMSIHIKREYNWIEMAIRHWVIPMIHSKWICIHAEYTRWWKVRAGKVSSTWSLHHAWKVENFKSAQFKVETFKGIKLSILLNYYAILFLRSQTLIQWKKLLKKLNTLVSTPLFTIKNTLLFTLRNTRGNNLTTKIFIK